MADDFNWSNFVATLVQENIEAILSKTASTADRLKDEFKHTVLDSFNTYLTRTAERYSTTKTILYKNKPVPLYSFYVPLDLKADKTIKSAGIQSITRASRFTVVAGTAGTGKSTFLKHLFLDSLRTRTGVPIFFELRSFNSGTGTLIDALYDSLKLFGYKLGKDFSCVRSRAVDLSCSSTVSTS